MSFLSTVPLRSGSGEKLRGRNRVALIEPEHEAFAVRQGPAHS